MYIRINFSGTRYFKYIHTRTHEDDDKEEKRFLNMEGDQAFKTLIIKQEGKFKKKRKRNKGKI